MAILRVVGLILCVAQLSAGCDLNRMAADQTAEFAEAGARGINGFWDYDMAGKAMPPTIMQGEALVAVSPDNDKLRVGLAKTYVSYAYGWLQDDWEIADKKSEFAKMDALEQRIRYLYLRARLHAMHAVRRHDDGGKLDEKLASGNAELVIAYLRETFHDAEDVGPLYYAGLAWGSAIAHSGGDVAMVADAAVARQLLERSIELDPTYNHAGGLAVLGTVEAAFPALFGGDLEKSKAYFDRSLALNERRNHLVLVGYAKNYAVAAQNRDLYVALLREVLEAPDQGWELRLSNKVARHRAERYIGDVDDLFDPALQ